MTTPAQPRGPRFVAGAIDLADVKARAQQRQQAASSAGGQTSVAGDPAEVARFAEVTPESFEQDLVVRSTQVAVVLLIGSERSEASEELKSILGRLVQAVDLPQEKLLWVVRYVDVDKNAEIAQALQVRAVPTVMALAGGRPLTQFQGAQPEEQVSQWVAAVEQAVAGKLSGLPPAGEQEPAADPRFEKAAQLIDAGEHAEAVAVYDEMLAEDPANAEARAARANALLVQRVSGSGGHEADRLIVAGDKVAAFDLLIEEIRMNAGAERDRAKAHLLELFGLFEADDDDVIAARTRMASALF